MFIRGGAALILVILAVSLSLSSPATSPMDKPTIKVVFTKVTDSHTEIPDGHGAFTSLSSLGIVVGSLDGSTVVFGGTGKDQGGIYRYADGALTRVVDTHTPIPGGHGTFTNFGQLAAKNKIVVFCAQGGDEQAGIYRYADGALTRVVDTHTPIPGGHGTFTYFGCFSYSGLAFDGHAIAFRGAGQSGAEGIYVSVEGSLAKVANNRTVIPGSDGENFSDLSNPAIDQGVVVFWGCGGRGHPSGIYKYAGGKLMRVADDTGKDPIILRFGDYLDIIPPFLSRPTVRSAIVPDSSPSLDKDALVFWSGITIDNAIYLAHLDTSDKFTLIIATASTPIPGGGSESFFTDLGMSPAISAGSIVFRGSGDGREGIYIALNDSLEKVVDNHDMLDGKKVRAVSFPQNGLQGMSLLFAAVFADDSEALFRADISWQQTK